MKENVDSYTVVFSLRKESYYEMLRVTDAHNEKYFMRLINLAKLTDLQFENDGYAVSEIEIARGLSHANIMKLMDAGETIIDGQRYAFAVSSFFPGEMLIDKIAREHICTVFDVKHIMSGILNALKYLHSRPTPIIHNGISPRSIMLDLGASTPLPRIMDFGHARPLDKQNRKCYMNGLSPFYLAPEMFKGLYSTRTDLYAVGALMYQMIFGIAPWQVDLSKVPMRDVEKVVLEARRTPLPIPDVKIFELDDNLLNVIAKSLNQDVDERFQSADEFLQALAGEITVQGSHYEKVSINPQPSKDISTPKKNVGKGFADVAGLDELKQRLQDEVIDLIKSPEKYKKLRVKIPNGILLYGPPGCGKTFIAEKFAEELGCNYMYVHCSDVASPYIHGGQEKIAALFQQAKENAPTVLFLDEIDAMLTDRSRHTNVSESGEVNEFLTQLNNCADEQVIVIGATNKPTAIDSAALRSGRMDIKMYVPAPSEAEREALLRLQLDGIAADDIDYSKLAKLTKGYVSKDICVLVNKAALISAKQDKESIAMKAMMDAIEYCKNELPSVSEAELLKHEQIRDKFESKKQARRPIGFNQ